jgi:hypothetical protein
MTKLNFASVDQAFVLGSDQIKDTQQEIANLKKIILQANVKAPKEDASSNLKMNKEEVTPPPPSYQRIGPPDDVTATFTTSKDSNDIDYSLFKLMQHPKFDEIVKNYIVMNNPAWLKQTNYVPNNTKEGFGMNYSHTAVTELQKYVLFFVVSVIIFLALSLLLKEN